MGCRFESLDDHVLTVSLANAGGSFAVVCGHQECPYEGGEYLQISSVSLFGDSAAGPVQWSKILPSYASDLQMAWASTGDHIALTWFAGDDCCQVACLGPSEAIESLVRPVRLMAHDLWRCCSPPPMT